MEKRPRQETKVGFEAIVAYRPTQVHVGVCKTLDVPHLPVIIGYRHTHTNQLAVQFINVRLER